MVLPLLVSRRFQVLFHSGPPVLFTFPSRYLFTIGHRLVFSLGRWSSQIPTRFHVSRGTWDTHRVIQDFVYRTVTVCGRPFHAVLLSFLNPKTGSRNPWSASQSGLGYSAFARRYWRNLNWFLLLKVLRCFSSPRSPHIPMYSVYDTNGLTLVGSPIRISPDQCLLAAPRSFSQLSTSFFASQCLGIRRLPLVAWP